MKRFILISFILLAACVSASAQWYLFPGTRKSKAPGKSDTAVKDSIELVGAQAEDLVGGLSDINSDYRFEMPETLKAALILPFRSGDKVNANFVELYSGALLAVREFGAQGKNVELTVLDEADINDPYTSEALAGNHLIIGPVNMDNILSGLIACPAGTYLVSPLEPKAASLVDSCRIIQSPTPWMRQTEEIVSWLIQETYPGDQLVILKDSVDNGIGEQTRYLLEQLAETGKYFTTAKSAAQLELEKEGNVRCFIASEREAYINGAVRDLSVLASTNRRNNFTLYATSKVRNSLGVSVEHLYNLQTRYTTTYYIDYDSPATKDFILAYRAVFKNEPGQFAFQGYDAMHYFLNVYSIYGVQWYKKLSEYSEKGIQNDYRFKSEDTVGKINSAVRRVMLGKDLSTTLQ